MISSATITSALLLVAIGVAPARAANDWTKGCLNGECSYDIAASDTSVPASMLLWGSQSAISDLTEAGGWTIMGCNATASSQAVRVVCNSADEEAAGCTHVLQNGAKDTVVRLPEACGKSAFAVVTSWDTADDQDIPSHVMKRINPNGKRATPLVRAVTIDSDFSKANPNTHGTVSFSVVGTSSNPSLLTNIPKSTTRRGLGPTRRSLFGSISSAFGSVKSAIGHVVGEATSEVGKIIGEAMSVAAKAGSKVTSAAGAAASAVKSAAGDVNNVGINKTDTLPPIKVNKSFNLATANVNCGDLGTIKLSADVAVDSTANVAIGVVAGGTIIPPKLKTFSISGGLTADLGGTLKLTADATGAPFDTGKIQIFTIGIPGLDIPDILQVGPTFSIDAQATLGLSAAVDVALGLNYHVANAAFVFPPNSALAPTGMPTPKDSMLNLSVSPNVTATGSLTAHVIPSLNFGVSAFAGKASATVFLDLDTSATLALSLGAGAKLTNAIPARRAVSTSAGVQGCVDAKTGIAANVGVQGDLFGLFDASKTVPLFTKNFDLFSKCIGINTKREFEPAAVPVFAPRGMVPAKRTVQLACPKSKTSGAKNLVADTVKAAEIKAI